MQVMKLVTIWALIGFLPVTICGAQEATKQKQEVYEIEKVVVTAPKTGDVPDYVQDTVTEAEIRQPVISGSVLDALENQAGLQFQRSSLSGTESGKLRLRGFDETRLKILKDGVSINRDGSYGNGPVDLYSGARGYEGGGDTGYRS